MAFGNKKLEKQDLIDAGLDPDKLREFQEKGVSKDDLNNFKTEFSTSVTELIKNSFTELETKLRTPVRTEPANNNNGNDNRTKTREEIEEEQRLDFMSDPTAYINKQVSNLGGRAAVEFKKLSRDLAWKEGVKSLRGFRNSTITKEIEEEWAKYTPEKMAQFDTDPSKLLDQIHNMVMGKHLDDIERDKDKKDGVYNLIQSGNTGGHNSVVNDVSNNRGSNEPQVTPEIEAQAKKFGMTGAEWVKEQIDMQEEEKNRFKVGAGA